MNVTVADVVESHGLSTSQARALLKRLVAEGKAEEVGVRKDGTVGRPPKLYEVDEADLQPAVEDEAQDVDEFDEDDDYDYDENDYWGDEDDEESEGSATWSF